uniref:Uncharacterized protein n=1 Tax=Cryptomonas curvata TaxID=233186 RepID=A0A7S0QLC8_9CRYP
MFVWTRQVQDIDSLAQTKLAYVVSGRIHNFDPSVLPGGVLTGIRVHSVQDCVDGGCGNFQGLGVSDGMSNNPVEEIRWAQKLNAQATEELSSGQSQLKRIMKALKSSEELQHQVEARITEIQDSEALLEKKG